MGKKTLNQKRPSASIWMPVGIAVVAVAVLVSASIYSTRKMDPRPVTASDQEMGAVRNVKGPATAKVTVVEYNDYL